MSRLMFLLVLCLTSVGIQSEEKRVGDHIIYYNVFNSSFIKPDVAISYRIPRSSTTGVINISVHKVNDKNTPDAIKANVQGRAKNYLSQIEELAFQEIKEGEAVYYLADFRFRPQEETDLNISIRIPGNKEPIELEFSKKLYKD